MREPPRDAHEGMNLAGVRRLPVVFVIDNNQWAYSTPSHPGAVDHLADRAAGYGFDGVVAERDRRARRYRRRASARSRRRAGGGADAQTSRSRCAWRAMQVHDDAFYVPKELFEEWARRDPIERFRSWLRDHAELTDDEEDEITSGVKRLLNDAIQRAEESPLPDLSTVTDGVFATPDELETPHHR